MSAHLDPKQLDALVAVAEHASFSKAAAALRLTLAAVSLRVSALEESLGQRLLVRGKRVTVSLSGAKLLAHVRQVRLMEADVLGELQGSVGAGQGMQTLSVAVNADSLTAWFLSGVAPTLKRHRLLLDVMIDDQDHTLEALKQGQVVGCVTTSAQSIAGCAAVPLGVMRYRCVASPGARQKWLTPAGNVSLHRMLSSPAVVFNRKDGLQDAFLRQHFALTHAAYPRHFVPAVDAFEHAIAQGLGWGMVPELTVGKLSHSLGLVEVFEDKPVDVPLVWQHWVKESSASKRLTQAVVAAAAHTLQPNAQA
jgi:LysR family transcriptional regulator, chromosome initiation inhibitor